MKKYLIINQAVLFIFFTFIVFLTEIQCKDEVINLYPVKVKLDEYDIDPKGGGSLPIKKTTASSDVVISGKSYSKNNIKFINANSWCMENDGIGEWLKIDVPLNDKPWNQPKGLYNVYRIQCINGIWTNKEIYFNNNRIKKIEVEFSNGEKRILNFRDNDLELQTFLINIKAKWIKLTIRELYKGNNNKTCVSNLIFSSWKHPDDMTEDQRRRWLEEYK